jgi:transcriptional regulator with GAF, ATPase, and Fis domain
MHMVYDSISRVAKGGTTVLIRGESGTGKELVARAPDAEFR